MLFFIFINWFLLYYAAIMKVFCPCKCAWCTSIYYRIAQEIISSSILIFIIRVVWNNCVFGYVQWIFPDRNARHCIAGRHPCQSTFFRWKRSLCNKYWSYYLICEKMNILRRFDYRLSAFWTEFQEVCFRSQKLNLFIMQFMNDKVIYFLYFEHFNTSRAFHSKTQ